LTRQLETRIRVIDIGLFGIEIGVWGHGLRLRMRVLRRSTGNLQWGSEGGSSL
jgi:hypothetical protein